MSKSFTRNFFVKRQKEMDKMGVNLLAVRSRSETINYLNKIIDNVKILDCKTGNMVKPFTREQVYKAVKQKATIYAKSHAIIVTPEVSNGDSWRENGCAVAKGKEKAKKKGKAPHVKFKKESKR